MCFNQQSESLAKILRTCRCRPNDFTDRLIKLTDAKIENFAQNLVLGLKMIINAAGLNAGFLRDVAHRRCVIAFIPKKSRGGGEYGFSSPLRLAQIVIHYPGIFNLSCHRLSILVVAAAVYCNKSNNC